ncbi:hypothetical protein [Aneurinibacillus migulanus]|uniref:hypothetical protein n=1 Tax=Aneurinibacillus migulanus TaxID=47500 RepID=UPI00209EF82C|nr:hypothetical protein [Aneurinibacillus migulanus]MCP1357662.1 hypothetical protein [Aneurinibacillus migulanus]
MEGSDSEKEEVGCALRFSRRKANVSFSNGPSFFSTLSPQEFVDVSNQMHIAMDENIFAIDKHVCYDEDIIN